MACETARRRYSDWYNASSWYSVVTNSSYEDADINEFEIRCELMRHYYDIDGCKCSDNNATTNRSSFKNGIIQIAANMP